MFRRLALLDMPVFSGWLSAALLDQPLARAEDLLDDLVNAQLVETTGTGSGVHSQYRFHDLIRVFARERLAAEEPAAERKAALERALGALLYLAEQAHRRYYGGDYVRLQSDAPRWPLPGRLVEQLVSDPLSWYERERAALVAGVRQAAQAGFAELCWSLALTRGQRSLSPGPTSTTGGRPHDIALAGRPEGAPCPRSGGDAVLHRGAPYQRSSGSTRLASDLTAAAQLFADAGDDQGMALVTRNIALLDRLSGRLDDAARGYEQALAIFRKTGDQVATAYVLHGLAQVKLELDELRQPRGSCWPRRCGWPRPHQCGRIEAQVLHRIGEAYLLAGELAGAVDAFELALATSATSAIPSERRMSCRAWASPRYGRASSARPAARCSAPWSWQAPPASGWPRRERCSG